MSVNYSVAGPYYNHPNPMSLTFNFKLIHEESLYVSYHSFILRDFTFFCLYYLVCTIYCAYVCSFYVSLWTLCFISSSQI